MEFGRLHFHATDANVTRSWKWGPHLIASFIDVPVVRSWTASTRAWRSLSSAAWARPP